jgi:hypothetical protein
LCFQETNEPLFIYGALKNVKSNIIFRCKSWENCVLLPSYENSMTNTSTATEKVRGTLSGEKHAGCIGSGEETGCGNLSIYETANRAEMSMNLNGFK